MTLLILSMSMTHVTNVNLHVICTVADTEKRGAVDLPALSVLFVIAQGNLTASIRA